MKRHIVFLVLVLLSGLLLVPDQLPAQEKLAGVHRVLPDEDLDAKAKAFDLRNHIDLTPDTPGDIFLVTPAPNTKLELFSVNMDEKSRLRLGKRQEFINAETPGYGVVLRHLVPEGIPNLALCITGSDRQRNCWIPRYDGESGALVLDAGFYPVREKVEDPRKKQYVQATEPVLSGPELLDQPFIFVERLKNADHLTGLVAEYRFAPKGEFNHSLPHHFLFAPLVVPLVVKLHVMEYKGGDGYLNPVAIKEITLGDNDVAVFSLNLHDLNNPNNQAEEKQYVFLVVDSDGEHHMWMPGIDPASGLLNGYGLGPLEKFMRWPYNK